MTAEHTRSDSLIEAVASFIDARRLLARGDRVVVGVSGGADSVALLAILRELSARGSRGYELTAAHLDHGLRRGAEADAAFVADLCKRWEVPCDVERRDVRAVAEREAVGIEEAARRARYDFLASVATKRGAAAVAVGHHADDNAETILYRIVRGTHLRGLAGIPARRRLGGTSAMLVRPLLETRREQIESFCREGELSWRTDETNAETTYRRNFIRHELLPLLRQRLNERADEALLRLAAAAGEAEAHLAGQGAAALRQAWRAGRSDPPARAVLDAATLAGKSRLVRTYALRAAMEGIGAPLAAMTAERLAELADLPTAAPPAALSLPGGIVARREGEELILEAAGAAGATAAAGDSAVEQVELQCPGETVLPDGRTVLCEMYPFDELAFRAHCAANPEGVEVLDADEVRGRLVCRRRRSGDAFVPLGAPGGQSVSDFLTNLKLPRRRRDEVVCLCDEEGIVYLAPLRIADRVRVTGATRNVLRVELREGGG